MNKRLRLSVSALKWIALICMLLDHIAYFFHFTGNIPIWFSMLGRLSAPLFLFCLSEGFAHTSNRRRYFLRIYLLSALMSAILFIMRFVKLGVRADGFYPENGILSLFSLLLIIWQGMDWLREKRLLSGLLAIFLPLLWPFIMARLLYFFPQLNLTLGLLCYSVLPTWGLLGDTSLPILAVGLLMYPLRSRRKLQAAAFALVTVLYHFAFVFITVAARNLCHAARALCHSVYSPKNAKRGCQAKR